MGVASPNLLQGNSKDQIVVCADGAANRLKVLNSLLKEKGCNELIPDFVIGDFDSVSSQPYFANLADQKGKSPPVYVSRPS